VAQQAAGNDMTASKVPDKGKQSGSGHTSDDRVPPDPKPGWVSSLWIWPAAAIVVATTAGTLFGSAGVILSAEAMGTILIAAGTLLLSGNRWLTLGLAAALSACSVLIATSFRLHASHYEGASRTTAAPNAPNLPVNWQGQMISQAMADHANFRGADLDGADLDGIQLSHKNFDGVQANGAFFRSSQLEYTSLRGASLRDACLEGANLTGADLTGADLSGADAEGVIVTAQAMRAALAWPATQSATAAACASGHPRSG
jgi:hypothetical protein